MKGEEGADEREEFQALSLYVGDAGVVDLSAAFEEDV